MRRNTQHQGESGAVWNASCNPGVEASTPIMATSTAIPTSNSRLESRPTDTMERRFVRQPSAAPTWAMTMPAMVIVVACR
jgi:hypothetical protein